MSILLLSLPKLECSFSPFNTSKGFRSAHFPHVESFFSPEKLKLNLILEVLLPSVLSTRVVTFEGITLRLHSIWWVREADNSPISWSFPMLVGAFCLVCAPSVWKVWPVSLNDCLLQLPWLLSFLWEWVVNWVADVLVGPCASLSLHVGGVLTGAFPFQIGILVIVQVRAKCPNRRHFRHWQRDVVQIFF
jgi:hypothetical protein